MSVSVNPVIRLNELQPEVVTAYVCKSERQNNVTSASNYC